MQLTVRHLRQGSSISRSRAIDLTQPLSRTHLVMDPKIIYERSSCRLIIRITKILNMETSITKLTMESRTQRGSSKCFGWWLKSQSVQLYRCSFTCSYSSLILITLATQMMQSWSLELEWETCSSMFWPLLLCKAWMVHSRHSYQEVLVWAMTTLNLKNSERTWGENAVYSTIEHDLWWAASWFLLSSFSQLQTGFLWPWDKIMMFQELLGPTFAWWFQVFGQWVSSTVPRNSWAHSWKTKFLCGHNFSPPLFISCGVTFLSKEWVWEKEVQLLPPTLPISWTWWLLML